MSTLPTDSSYDSAVAWIESQKAPNNDQPNRELSWILILLLVLVTLGAIVWYGYRRYQVIRKKTLIESLHVQSKPIMNINNKGLAEPL